MKLVFKGGVAGYICYRCGKFQKDNGWQQHERLCLARCKKSAERKRQPEPPRKP